MRELAVDTHPLVWFAAGRTRKLGRRARRAFETFERGEVTLHVPAPVVLETWFLWRNGTIRAEGSLSAWWRAIDRPGLVREDLTSTDIIDAADLAWDHDDPFDRLIVVTARRLGLPLVTSDAAITEWGGVEVIW